MGVVCLQCQQNTISLHCITSYYYICSTMMASLIRSNNKNNKKYHKFLFKPNSMHYLVDIGHMRTVNFIPPHAYTHTTYSYVLVCNQCFELFVFNTNTHSAKWVNLFVVWSLSVCVSIPLMTLLMCVCVFKTVQEIAIRNSICVSWKIGYSHYYPLSHTTHQNLQSTDINYTVRVCVCVFSIWYVYSATFCRISLCFACTYSIILLIYLSINIIQLVYSKRSFNMEFDTTICPSQIRIRWVRCEWVCAMCMQAYLCRRENRFRNHKTFQLNAKNIIACDTLYHFDSVLSNSALQARDT